MNIDIFHIRLTKENLQTDQDNLNKFLDSVTVKKTATELVLGQPNFWSILVFYEDTKYRKQSEKTSVTTDNELTVDEKRVYEILREWRKEKASELQVPSFIICHNAELMTIAKEEPQNLADFTKIKGFGEQKIAKFGNDIIAVLSQFDRKKENID